MLSSFQHAVIARKSLDFDPDTELGYTGCLVMQFGTSEAKIKHVKTSRRLRSFFKGGRSVRAAQPMDVHDVQPQNESQMVDEHDRSTKLEDLNLKDWPLEDSFKPLSNFLDSLLSNSQDTELERSIRTPSPSSVSSSKRSLYETSIQIYQKQDQQLKAMEQQMDEMSIFLAQSTLRREKLLARALAQMQSINAEVQIHLRNADINISNCVESEPLTPPTKDRGVDPTPLDTTTVGIADTLPEYHAGDNGLRERNLYSSDTKSERISISPSTSLSQDSLSNSHFPGTKSLISTTKLLPNLLKDSFEPHSAKRGLQDFIQVDPSVFINWLPRCSAKTQPTGHRRDRPPRTDCEHSWQKILLSLYDGRRRGRPPRQVLPHIDRRDKGVAVLRTTIPALRQTQSPQFSLLVFLMLHACCMSCCYWMVLSTQSKPHSTSFQGGRRCRQRLIYTSAIFVLGIQFCPFLTILM